MGIPIAGALGGARAGNGPLCGGINMCLLRNAILYERYTFAFRNINQDTQI
jgi:hypothetical protein